MGTSSDVLHAQLFASVTLDSDVSGYCVVACSGCGFVFADVSADQEEIDATYKLVGRPTERSFDLERLRDTARYVADRVAPQARILDAGCGTGALLTYLKTRGFSSLVGLDPSPAAIEQLKRRGFAGHVGSLSRPGAIGTFDVIVLAHVLEHVRELQGVFDALRSLLRPGGYVYAEVPNATKYVEALYEPFHDINTEHINHFSSYALARLFEMHGFRCIDARDKWIECAANTPYPATYGLWQLSQDGAQGGASLRDDALTASIEEYIVASTSLLQIVAERMSEDLHGRHEVALWGAGEFSQRLACDTRFAGRELVAVVDGSEQRQGLWFDGLKIQHPKALREMPNVPIIVGSVLQRDEIVRAARDGLALNNQVVTLYKPSSRPISEADDI